MASLHVDDEALHVTWLVGVSALGYDLPCRDDFVSRVAIDVVVCVVDRCVRVRGQLRSRQRMGRVRCQYPHAELTPLLVDSPAEILTHTQPTRPVT